MNDYDRVRVAQELLRKHGNHDQRTHGHGGGGMTYDTGGPAGAITLADDPGSKVKLGSGPVVSASSLRPGDLVDVVNGAAPRSGPKRVWVISSTPAKSGPFSGYEMKFLAPKHRVPPPGGTGGRGIYDLGFSAKTPVFVSERQYRFHSVASAVSTARVGATQYVHGPGNRGRPIY